MMIQLQSKKPCPGEAQALVSSRREFALLKIHFRK